MYSCPEGEHPSRPPRRLSLTVPNEYYGQKADRLLRELLHLSGTVIRRAKLVPHGITLDGLPISTGHLVRTGQSLTVIVGDSSRRSGILPAPGPLDVVYEDEDLIVLNKAPGVLVHPSQGHFDDTLGNFLLYYYDTKGWGADFHPVHRLDKGTSGLLVAALHPHAQELLKAQLHTPAFRRVYLAVCHGVPSPAAGVIDAPIARSPHSLVERMVRQDGQPARTYYQVLGGASGRSLLRLELETGRTHQIRVHLAHIGHPLVGDFLYGTEERELISRPALHAVRLSLLHPISGSPLSWTAPAPGDMARLIPHWKEFNL